MRNCERIYTEEKKKKKKPKIRNMRNYRDLGEAQERSHIGVRVRVIKTSGKRRSATTSGSALVFFNLAATAVRAAG